MSGCSSSGARRAGNQVLGNFIGTDITGTLDLGNSQEGVRIENAPSNSIGGSTATDRNLISANHTGVAITGPQALGNVVQGNFIGTDITGTEVARQRDSMACSSTRAHPAT